MAKGGMGIGRGTLLMPYNSDPERPYARDIEVFITEREIHARIGELAETIADDYRLLGPTYENPLLMVGVLKGVVPFITDLMRAMPFDIPVAVDFMSISSYGPETRHTGGVRVLKDLELSVTGRHVLIVEDIVDTGLTLAYLMKQLRTRQPKSLRVCSLLDRESVRLLDLRIQYTGFTIPDQFVVGYGLDSKERYRNLPYIGVLRQDSKR